MPADLIARGARTVQEKTLETKVYPRIMHREILTVVAAKTTMLRQSSSDHNESLRLIDPS